MDTTNSTTIQAKLQKWVEKVKSGGSNNIVMIFRDSDTNRWFITKGGKVKPILEFRLATAVDGGINALAPEYSYIFDSYVEDKDAKYLILIKDDSKVIISGPGGISSFGFENNIFAFTKIVYCYLRTENSYMFLYCHHECDHVNVDYSIIHNQDNDVISRCMEALFNVPTQSEIWSEDSYEI